MKLHLICQKESTNVKKLLDYKKKKKKREERLGRRDGEP